jgi:hypothetical protein
MTLSNGRRPERPPQTRSQKIVMWSVFAVAAVMLTVAIVLFVVSRAPLF